MQPILYLPLVLGVLPIIVLAVILALLVYCIYTREEVDKDGPSIEALRPPVDTLVTDEPYFLPAPSAGSILRTASVVPYSVSVLKEIAPLHTQPRTLERRASISGSTSRRQQSLRRVTVCRRATVGTHEGKRMAHPAMLRRSMRESTTGIECTMTPIKEVSVREEYGSPRIEAATTASSNEESTVSTDKTTSDVSSSGEENNNKSIGFYSNRINSSPRIFCDRNLLARQSTDRRSSIDSERRSSIDSVGPSTTDSERRSSIGSERRSSIDSGRRSSIGSERRFSLESVRPVSSVSAKISINGSLRRSSCTSEQMIPFQRRYPSRQSSFNGFEDVPSLSRRSSSGSATIGKLTTALSDVATLTDELDRLQEQIAVMRSGRHVISSAESYVDPYT